MFACLLIQEAALEDMKKELQARPTSKMVDDLRKKVKILQVISFSLYIVVSHWAIDFVLACMNMLKFHIISLVSFGLFLGADAWTALNYIILVVLLVM